MKNNQYLIQVTLLTLAVVAIIWEVIAFVVAQRFAELPKQLLAVSFLCWLVIILFRNPQDDDDWAY